MTINARMRIRSFRKNPHCTLCGQLMTLEYRMDNTACLWSEKKGIRRKLICNKCRIDKNKEWKYRDIWNNVKRLVNSIKYILFRNASDGKR